MISAMGDMWIVDPAGDNVQYSDNNAHFLLIREIRPLLVKTNFTLVPI